MVSRRSFLKKLGAICGATIVAPIALLKLDPWAKVAAMREANLKLWPIQRIIIQKARQQGINHFYFKGVPIVYVENLPV